RFAVNVPDVPAEERACRCAASWKTYADDVDRESFDGELVRAKPNPWYVGLSLVPALAAAMLVVASLATGDGYAVLAPHLTVLSAVLLASVLRNKPNAVLEEVRVRADARGLKVGELTVPQDRIRDALIVPQADLRFMVQVTRKRALPLELYVVDRDEGRRV